MRLKLLAVPCILLLILAVSACTKKKEEQEPVVPRSVMPGQQTLPPGQQPLPPGHQTMGPKVETTVIVPDSVKGKWDGVVILVKDKETKKEKEYTVNLNSDLKLPDSNIKISVGDFLPDFKMNGRTITSLSNEPNNPAVRVKVFDNDKEIFKGWLYLKFPDVHPFEHPKYSIALKNGVKKS